MRKIHVVFALTAVAVSPLVCMAISSKAYVHKGLAALYDGLENDGRGQYDAQKVGWANLIGPVLGTTDIDFGHTSDGSLPVWDGDHLIVSGAAGKKNWAHGMCDLFRKAIRARSATVDYCFSGDWNSPFYFGKNTRMLLNQIGTGRMLFLLVSHTAVPEANSIPLPDKQLKTFSVKISDTASMYTNAVPILENGTITSSNPTGEPDFWLGISPQFTSVDGSGTSWWGSGGNFHSLRLYTCALTADELAWNHKVDEVRYMGGVWSGRGVSVLFDPVEVGVPTPDYGARLTDNSSETFSIAYDSVTFDDGVTAIEASDGVRCTFAGATVQVGDGEPVEKSAASFAQELQNDEITYVTWRFDNVQYRIVANVLDEETVRVNGALCCTNWPGRGTTVRLTATSSAGAQFETWLGDTNGLADVTSPIVDVPSDRPRVLTAKFGAVVVGWGYDETGGTISNGNWRISVSVTKSGDLSITQIQEGEGVLDLTDFEAESGCGKKVTAIANNAKLGGYAALTAFIGPDVVSVGSSGFGIWSGGTNLGKITRIVLSDDVATLGDWALYKQTGLTDLSPRTFAKVTQLGSTYGTVFTDCLLLTGKLSFPNLSTSNNGYQNFKNCKALQEISLPKLPRIQRYEFAECGALTNVTLSPEITFLGYGAFRNCAKLKILSPTNFTAVASCGEYSDYGVFQGCSALNLPLAFPQLAVVPREMFKSCSSLLSVALPAATDVHEKAFYYIASGATIRLGRVAPTFGANAVASKSAPFPRVVTRGGSRDAGWQALVAANAETFADYKRTKADYPGAQTFGLLNLGGWSWAIDDAPGLLLFVR